MGPQHSTAAAQPEKAAAKRRRAHIIKPRIYSPASLSADVNRLSNPREPMTDGDILNVLVKYFHAFIFPGAENHAVPLSEISDLFEELYNIWRGEDDFDHSSKEFEAYCRPLRMLGDLPKSAHIFRSIAGRPLAASDRNETYRALDLDAGAGILSLAAALQGRRNGFSRTDVAGVERDTDMAARAAGLLERMDLGTIIAGDAENPALYERFSGAPLHFAANETIPKRFAKQRRDHFTASYAALFRQCDGQLKHTIFFPEALVVYEPKSKHSVVLSKNNRFQLPNYYRRLDTLPQAVTIEGKLQRLHRLGRDFVQYTPRPFLSIMPGLW